MKKFANLRKSLIVVLILFISLEAIGGARVSCSDYTWEPLKIGAGGWVVGMFVHPTLRNLRYIRTDVSGAYRWDEKSSKWKQLVTSNSLPAEYVAYGKYDGVCSLVGSPRDPNIAYMAFKGQIFKSTNRGDKWVATNFGTHNVIMNANGKGRQEGERLAVDPHNSDVVYFGSIKNNLWVTFDGGNNWTMVGSIPMGEPDHGVNTVIFDDKSGTINSKTKDIYVTVDKGGVFKSSDGGQSWNKISDSGPGTNRRYRDAEIGPDGTYYVVCSNEGGGEGCVWKYNLGNWTNITPAGSQNYYDLAVDPKNGNQLAVMMDGRGAWTSVDQGKTWLSHRSFTLVSPTVEWLGKQITGWLSVGEIIFDPFESGKLWFAEGFGVWYTKDLTQNKIEWTEQSAGIEETCGNAVICPPGGKPITAMWDIGAFYHSAPDLYNAQRAYSDFVSCWYLDWCPADPDFIVGVFQTQHQYNNKPRSSYSTDGGKTWQTFASQPEDLTFGCVAVSANSKDNIVRLPSNDKLPYYTIDRGKSWTQSTFSGYTNTGYTSYTSPIKPLCADRVVPSTFYFYHKNNGIFKSTDGGANWVKVSDGPVLNRYNSMMKTTPGSAKDIWFAEGKQENVVGGLWHSIDGGSTWIAVSGIEQAFSFGFGKAQNAGGYPTLFVAGVIDGQNGIYRSTNSGATWDKIVTYPLGIFDWIDDIDGDKDVFGKVYVCFAGSGFAYGVQNRKKPR